VTIVSVSDIGEFADGNGARGLKLVVHFEMTPAQAVRAATAVTAKARRFEGTIRAVKAGLLVDLVAVEAARTKEIRALRHVKDGATYKQP
jgi:imidazolonepropionase-like amidohydrolase